MPGPDFCHPNQLAEMLIWECLVQAWGEQELAAYLQLSGQLLALQRQQPRLLASLQTRQWQQQAEQKKQPILVQLTRVRLRAKSNH